MSESNQKLDINLYFGIKIKGKIVGRSKRQIIAKQTGEAIIIHKYKILCKDHIHEVDIFRATEAIALDTIIEWPIKISAFQCKSGVRYTLQYDNQEINEIF